MSHVSSVKVQITDSDIQNGLLEKALQKINKSFKLKAGGIINEGMNAAWQKQQVDYSFEKECPAVGFVKDGNGYKLVGDAQRSIGHTGLNMTKLAQQLPGHLVDVKVDNAALLNNWNLVEKRVGQTNDEEVMVFEVNY